jgi:hypothetical protein
MIKRWLDKAEYAPDINEFKKWDEGLTEKYKKWLDEHIEMEDKERERLAPQLEYEQLTDRKSEFEKLEVSQKRLKKKEKTEKKQVELRLKKLGEQVPSLGDVDGGKAHDGDHMEGVCAELTPSNRKNIKAARTVSSSPKFSHKIGMDHRRAEILKKEKTLQAYRQARETPELGIASNSIAKFKSWDCGYEGAASERGADNPSKAADNLSKGANELKPDQPVEIACIWTFFGLIEGKGYADLFQDFLDSKYSDDQSKYLEQLRQFKDKMEQLVEEDADTAKEGVNSDRSCLTTLYVVALPTVAIDCRWCLQVPELLCATLLSLRQPGDSRRFD